MIPRLDDTALEFESLFVKSEAGRDDVIGIFEFSMDRLLPAPWLQAVALLLLLFLEPLLDSFFIIRVFS